MKQVFLRHKRGNGRIYGNDAFATESSLIDHNSSIGDHVEVYDSELISSVVTDHVIISGARIVDSYISDNVRIHGAVNVTNSTLSGECRLWGDAKISDCTLSNVFAFGTAILAGFSLSAFVRIHQGVWRSPPRFERLSAPNLQVTISECIPGYGHIGCFCLPYETWFRPGYRQRIGRVSGWTPEMVEFTYRRFQEWAVSPSG